MSCCSILVAGIIAFSLFEVPLSRDVLTVYDDEESVRSLSPDQAKLLALDEGLGVIGSAHCMLVPFWAERLGRSELVAHQVSSRGGELHCEHRGDRVIMSGQCVLFLTGSIHL